MSAISETSPPVLRRVAGLFIWRDPVMSISVVVVLILVVMALAAPWLGTVNPGQLAAGPRAALPSAAHWFGTDMLGRDVYSRVVYGARVSLVIGSAVAVISVVIGLVIGLVAGSVRWLDGVIMRIMDGLMSIPSILLAIALTALTRGSVQNVILAITIAELPRVARLVRGAVLTAREQTYVDAAITTGLPLTWIMIRHIMPNTLAPLMVQGTHIFAHAMLIEAGLSFIGAGTPPNIPSWGNIMAEGRALWQIKPYLVFFPAIFLSCAVLAVNMIGDGLRDRFDPRMRGT
ncbi:ABC transporter permease [Chelatococcus asaccharovorans]|uniref:Peptide/nickel transport system permease protein n=1 Tax=Chelatococcus asaccharovorans TaxID=28210 RepID=A0A2V3UAU9_9HYPH|nr:ABC transporter permease [Chelatococcus asaccharovorans]MBS7707720.1 ABC transporter permease [Chelatococcus asaccharovorans]PXW55297.1 peptide/nickel transport system permease protein [Chelatococcus asaccharovorans]